MFPGRTHRSLWRQSTPRSSAGSCFYQKMAETANACIAKGTDLTGLVQGILAQASLLQAQSLRSQLLSIKDELMASAGSLSDLAEQID